MKRIALISLPLAVFLLCGCGSVESGMGLGINTPSLTRKKLAGLRRVRPGEHSDRVVEKAGYPLETRLVESYEVWEWYYLFRVPGGWAVFQEGHVVETGWADHEDPDRRKADVWLAKGERLLGGSTGKLAARKRRSAYLELNAGRPVKIREMIANGEIGMGMSAGDVAASWGEPDRKKTIQHDYGPVEQWIYGRTDIFFENGEVSVWQVPD